MAGALAGLKILDFSTLLPGPFATMNFADMGAEVLRVASKSRPDILEFEKPALPGTEFSAVAAQVWRNKKTITLNLKNAKSIEIIHTLIQEYDIILEQFRPGVMDKLNLGYEDLKKINPRIIYCSLTGYGQSGSMSMRAGHDINYLALSGIVDYSGSKEYGPFLNGIQIADVASGTNNTMISILAAVIYRQNTGKGQYLDVSMTDGAFALNIMSAPGCLVDGVTPKRGGGWVTGSSLYDYYETGDGKYVSFGGAEPKFFANFCKAIGKDEWASLGVQAGDDIKNEVKKIIRTRTRDEWAAIFNDADACFEPVLSLQEALGSDLSKIREMVVEVPGDDGLVVRQLGSPFKFSESKVEYRHTGKPIGKADTKEVLKAIGYDDEVIEQLDKEGVLA